MPIHSVVSKDTHNLSLKHSDCQEAEFLSVDINNY